MGAKPFPVITDGTSGDVPNGFYVAADSDRGSILLRTPGLETSVDIDNSSEVRELHAWNDYLYALVRRGSESVLWRVDPVGATYVELGTVTSSFTGPAWMEHNPTQLGIFDGVSGWVYTPSTGSFVQISAAGFLGSGGFAYQDKYGMSFQPGSRVWQLSGLDDFLAWDALDYYAKETQPDNIVALTSHMRQPIVCGELTTEVYHNTGGTDTSGNTATFERDAGGLVMYGCGAAKSLNTFSGIAPVWLSHEGQIIQLAGYNGQVISNQMMERAIKGMAGFDDAIAFSYRDKGHVFYQITFPTGDQTWVYDAATKMWHKRTSFKADGSGWGRHRANCYALLNNRHWVGDFENGKIYEMSQDYLDDAGEPIRRVLYSTDLGDGKTLIFFNPMLLIMDTGIGLESGLDPQVMWDYSGDGGKTWSDEIWKSCGKIGDFDHAVYWSQPGAARRRLNRFTFSDPVAWEILGLDLGV